MAENIKIRMNLPILEDWPLDKPNIQKGHWGPGSRGYSFEQELPSDKFNGLIDSIGASLHDKLAAILDQKAAGDVIHFFDWMTYEDTAPRAVVLGNTIRRPCWGFDKNSGGTLHYGTDVALHGGVLLLKFVITSSGTGRVQFVVGVKTFAGNTVYVDEATTQTFIIEHDGTQNKQYFVMVNLGDLPPGSWMDLYLQADNTSSNWTLAPSSDGQPNVLLFAARLF